jgi:hypothetical protein
MRKLRRKPTRSQAPQAHQAIFNPALTTPRNAELAGRSGS